MVFSRVGRLGGLHIFDLEKVVVTAHLILPVLIFPFVTENFSGESDLEYMSFIQSFRHALRDGELSSTFREIQSPFKC